jgi:hypothetical protein
MKGTCHWTMSGVCGILGAVMVWFGLLFVRDVLVLLPVWSGESTFSMLLLGAILLVVGGRLVFSAVLRSAKRLRTKLQGNPL